MIDKAIAYHPRDRYPTRAMLDTLQSIANPIPPMQPLLIQLTVVSAPPPQTVPVKPQPNPQNNSQNNILIYVTRGILLYALRTDAFFANIFEQCYTF